MKTHYDVVIVGAGPAGSTCALAIKKRFPDCGVLLVDKATFPRDKVCGDGIGPGSIVIAEELGIDGLLFDDQLHVLECILYGSERGPLTTEIPKVGVNPNYGSVVKREIFDDRLREAAVEKGAEFLGGTRFVSTRSENGVRLVEFEGPTGPKILSTKLLVGADGAHSRVRKALTIDRNGDRHTAIAIRGYVEMQSVPDDHKDKILFEFDRTLSPGYGWLFPLIDKSANVGVGIMVSDFKRKKLDLKVLFQEYVSTLESRGFVFGETSDIATYLLPNGAHRPKLTYPDAVLIGDAASMINPLTGEGIYYGMFAGKLVADKLSLADSSRGMDEFDKAFSKEFDRHYANNYFALRVLRNWRMTQWAFGLLEKNPQALQKVVGLMFGHGHLSRKAALKIGARSLFWR